MATCNHKRCACADYEILSGGGNIANLPPDVLEGADKAVENFLKELTDG